MDESTVHKGKPAKVVRPGLQVAKAFLGWLVTLLIPSHEELLNAGVYIGERDDRVLFGGEEMIYEKMRRNNDEGTDLLPAERYSRSDGGVDEE